MSALLLVAMIFLGSSAIPESSLAADAGDRDEADPVLAELDRISAELQGQLDEILDRSNGAPNRNLVSALRRTIRAVDTANWKRRLEFMRRKIDSNRTGYTMPLPLARTAISIRAIGRSSTTTPDRRRPHSTQRTPVRRRNSDRGCCGLSRQHLSSFSRAADDAAGTLLYWRSKRNGRALVMPDFGRQASRASSAPRNPHVAIAR